MCGNLAVLKKNAFAPGSINLAAIHALYRPMTHLAAIDESLLIMI